MKAILLINIDDEFLEEYEDIYMDYILKGIPKNEKNIDGKIEYEFIDINTDIRLKDYLKEDLEEEVNKYVS